MGSHFVDSYSVLLVADDIYSYKRSKFYSILFKKKISFYLYLEFEQKYIFLCMALNILWI